MLPKNLFILVVFATAVYCKHGDPIRSDPIRSDDDDDKVLSWPKKYYVEVTKFIVHAGLTEDLKVWKTKKQSRVDYNNGAVKTIETSGGSSRHSRGYKYEIHPETHGLDELNKITCSRTWRSRWSVGSEEVLPDADDFEYQGIESWGNQNCSKFTKYTETNDYVADKETVWAAYNEKEKAFVPVRYEIEVINKWAGNSNERNIWEFDYFEFDFDEKKAFDVTQFCPDYVKITEKDDEAVTKHLMFIEPGNKHHVDHVFSAFKKNFNRNYAKNEHVLRKTIFQKNLRLIKTTNRKNLGYKLAVNKFSDRTPEEIKRHMGLKRRPEGKKGLEFPYDSEKLSSACKSLPKEYDLRLEGIISPVQNQEECGSCYTFGTTSAIEGAIARKNAGQLIRLSNQAIIDCAWEFGNSGCEGGTDAAVYEWAKKYGMPKLAEYGAYAAREGYCGIVNMTTTYKISNFVDVTPYSVSALKVALIENGPLSVSVSASSDTFIQYSGGIYYGMNCGNEPRDLDHEVTLIGYGEQYGETFWILKNSWGQDWGISGFMHISAKDNNCGIMTEPTYVLL